MAPITCQALDGFHEPLVGLRVILECFNGGIDSFGAFTSNEGIIDAWASTSDLDINPPASLVDSQDYSTCRVTFVTSEYFDDLICCWPSIQVDIRLHDNSQHFITLYYNALGYRVVVKDRPTEISLPQIEDAVPVVNPREPSYDSFLTFEENKSSISEDILLEDLDNSATLEKELELEVAEGQESRGVNIARKRGRPKKSMNCISGSKETKRHNGIKKNAPRKRGRPAKGRV